MKVRDFAFLQYQICGHRKNSKANPNSVSLVGFAY